MEFEDFAVFGIILIIFILFIGVMSIFVQNTNEKKNEQKCISSGGRVIYSEFGHFKYCIK